MLMYVGGVVLLRNFPFVGEVRLAVQVVSGNKKGKICSHS
jgi:hypothetical protein